MARYAVTQSQYTPYSFDALWKASEYLTQQHQLAAANFAALDAQASPLQQLANNPVDANEYAVVKNYMGQLDTASEKFQKYGLKGGAFQDFVNMNRNYTKTIKPIETALTQRQALATVYNEMYIKDPTITVARKPHEIALSEFMSGQVTPEYISGEAVKREVAAIATRFAAQYAGTTKNKLDRNYDEFIQKYGLNADEIFQQLNTDPNSAINTIINSVLNANPVYSKLDQTGQAAIREYAKIGAYQAIGVSQPHIQSNLRHQDANLYYTGRKDARDQEVHDTQMEILRRQMGGQPEAQGDYQTHVSAKASDVIATRLSKRMELVDYLIKNHASLSAKKGGITQEDLPELIRENLNNLARRRKEQGKSVSWIDVFHLYKQEIKAEYDNVVSFPTSYGVPATITGYDNLLNAFFSGSNGTKTVTPLEGKGAIQLNQLQQNMTSEVFRDKVNFVFDPSIYADGMIINVPKEYDSAKGQFKVVQYKFPFSEFVNSSFFDQPVGPDNKSLNQLVKEALAVRDNVTRQQMLGELYPKYVQAFIDQYRTSADLTKSNKETNQ